MTDLEIANSVEIKDIGDIAKKLNLSLMKIYKLRILFL